LDGLARRFSSRAFPQKTKELRAPKKTSSNEIARSSKNSKQLNAAELTEEEKKTKLYWNKTR